MTEEEMEATRLKNAIELEKQKWLLKKKELKFLEAGHHLRALNQQLWQVPGIVIAITGGVWYGAASVADQHAKMVAFLFAAIASASTIFVIWRLRAIIDIQIGIQNKFNKLRRQNGKNTVVWCWTVLLAAATLISLIGACHSEKVILAKGPISPADSEQKQITGHDR